MHNRVRMVVASLLTKDLDVTWQVGARHFMRLLADVDAPMIHDPPDRERSRRGYPPTLVDHAEAIARYRARSTAPDSS
jgi:deoxyribodipyrimidine photolyase